MEHQDWTTVTFRRTYKNTRSHEKNRIDKVTDLIPKISINPISLQILIRTRIEMKLSQSMADNICKFPRNTFKNIESKRIIPSDEQKQMIQQHFNVYLKTCI